MAYATLEILANRVREDLESHYEGRPVRQAGALERLLETLLTAQAPPELRELARRGEVRGLATHLKALERHLQDESRLPEAICARYKYKVSETKARSRYGIPRRVWSYFHDLARRCRWNPDLRVPLVSYERFGWHDDLEERFVEVEAILDMRALEGMLIGALEAYLSPRGRRRKGYEVYGVNLGMTREVHRRKLRDGLRITKYVSVMRAHAQLSADAEYGYVLPNARSLEAILTATNILYPQYQAVGDFHSHPYDDFALLERKKGWKYAGADEASNIEMTQVMSELEQRILVTFVLAIARCAQRVTRSQYRGLRNTIQVSLGNCRVIVAAYRSLESGRLTETNIRLRLSGTTS